MLNQAGPEVTPHLPISCFWMDDIPSDGGIAPICLMPQTVKQQEDEEEDLFQAEALKGIRSGLQWHANEQYAESSHANVTILMSSPGKRPLWTAAHTKDWHCTSSTGGNPKKSPIYEYLALMGGFEALFSRFWNEGLHNYGEHIYPSVMRASCYIQKYM